MKVIEHINNATDTQFSYEIIPPLRGKGIKIIIDMYINAIKINVDKSELEFLRLNLIYSQKCQTRKLFSTGYKVGTPEYKKCILNKGKKINE